MEPTVRQALADFYSLGLVELNITGPCKSYIEKLVFELGYMDVAAASFPSLLLIDREHVRKVERVFSGRGVVGRYFWMFVMFCEIADDHTTSSLMAKASDVERLAKYKPTNDNTNG